MPDLLPIGTFAKLSNLSIKQLRYYHEQRLLIPAEVDGSTGYRYYRRQQAEVAELIALLRSLDLPAKLISELLHDPSPTRVRTVLKSQRTTLESRLSEAQVALAKLDRLVQEEHSRSTAQATDPARNPLARLSDTAIARLRRAQELAEQYGATEYSPLTLLLAMSLSEDSLAMQLLIAMAVDPGDLRTRLEEAVASGPEARGSRVQVNRAMKIAYQEAADSVVDTRHLLIGLLVTAPNPAAQLLASVGVSAARLRAQVARRGQLLGSEPIQPPGKPRMYPLELFTKTAQSILVGAQRKVGEAGLITCEALLLAIADELDSSAVTILRSADVESQSVAEAMLPAVDRGNAHEPDDRLIDALHLAAQEAGEGKIESGHLLIGIILRGHTPASTYLLEAGLTVKQARAELGAVAVAED